jgi:hypothetical protein
MHVYASPRRGYCASCDGMITGRPVWDRDETYCCVGCVHGGPCVCTYEADLAEDGVDRVGLPFPVAEGTPADSLRSREPSSTPVSTGRAGA